jgi:DNA-binding NtrC family response regulator
MKRHEDKIWLLLVDDEEEFLDATERALSRRGFDVTTAPNGWRAVSIAQQLSFDVAVLDVKMPGLDGIEVFRQLHVLFPELPVILLTGHGNVEQAFETSREGVFEYLAKPCDIEDLARIARIAAGQKRQQEGSSPPDPEVEITVLLVDDEQEYLSAVSTALRRRGFDVTPVESAQKALALTEEKLFDVALVDVRMPVMDGLDLLRGLKVVQPSMGVIMLTGRASIPEAIESMQRGAFDVLIKPVSVHVLVAKIREAFWRGKELAQERLDETVSKLLEGISD